MVVFDSCIFLHSISSGEIITSNVDEVNNQKSKEIQPRECLNYHEKKEILFLFIYHKK